MIPQIKKILYSTDLSKNSAYAFYYAVDLAQKKGATIVILHAIEPVPAYGPARRDDQSRRRLRKVSGAIIVYQKIVKGGSDQFFPAYQGRNVLPEVLVFENLAPMQHFNL